MQTDKYLTEEKIISSLCSLYEKSGYNRYKMSRFEQYSLYIENKDFLTSDRIVTFTDKSGKLLALKPDVTLSIVKGAVDKKSECEKVYYSESVFRASKSDGEIKELTQIGVECISSLDGYSRFELISLAHKSLKEINEGYILALSHMKYLSSVLEEIKDIQIRRKITDCISKKNTHTLLLLLDEAGADEKISKCLLSLADMYGDIDTCLDTLSSLAPSNKAEEALKELKTLSSLLKSAGLYENTVIDFSIINDMNYYNGITFQGFLPGVAQSVLSGGEYGKLLEKFSSKLDAIGFAIYLDSIERLTVKKNHDADVFLLYAENDDMISVYKKAEELKAQGFSVRTGKNKADSLRCKEIIILKGGKNE